MPKGPRVYEIFSNKDLDHNAGFRYDQQESMQQTKISKKSHPAPEPPGMKKFGGYKPKILSSENTDDLIESNNDAVPGVPGVPFMNRSSLKKKAHPAPPAPGNTASTPVLTKPKPFIVGDKDTPMVLSTVGDNDDDDGVSNINKNGVSELTDTLDDAHIYSTVIENDDIPSDSQTKLQNAPSLDALAYSENSNLLSTRTEPEPEGFVNFGLDDDLPLPEDDKAPLETPMAHRAPSSPAPPALAPLLRVTAQPTVAPTSSNDNALEPRVFFTSGSKPTPDLKPPEEVFIPDPDYEEEEQTMNFYEDEEETDFGSERGEENKLQRQRRAQPVLKTYVGEDLSHFLSEDEEDVVNGDKLPSQPVNSKPSKPQKQPKTRPVSGSVKDHSKKDSRPKIDNNRTLFNQPKSVSKKRGSKKDKPQQFNSVRSFSYADSKYGTQGRAAGRGLMSAGAADDSEMFLQSESSYESFLRSRHGDAIPFPDANDSGIDEDFVPSSSNKKDGPIWKKLTLRLKNRKSKDYS